VANKTEEQKVEDCKKAK